MRTPGPTARAVLLVTAGNLLPLLFVAGGALDLPLLLVCYGVEAVLLPRDPESSGTDAIKLRLLAVLLTLVLLPRALFAVDWSPGALLVLLGTLVLTAAGPWLARRDPRAATVRGGLGAVMWRMALLLVGGVVALSWAEDLTVLRGAGWTPEPVGDVVATYPAWALNELVAGLGLAPLTAAAVAFVVFKTLNEGLWTALRSLSPARPAPRSTSTTDA